MTEHHLRKGLQTIDWPGRLQLLQPAGGGRWLLDGAHNPAGARVLRQTVESGWPDSSPTLILGMLADKSCQEICSLLTPIAGRVLTVPVDTARSADPKSLAIWCAETAPARSVQSFDQFETALHAARQDPFVIVTGSLYLVGQALEALGAIPVAAGIERHLNDWSIRT